MKLTSEERKAWARFLTQAPYYDGSLASLETPAARRAADKLGMKVVVPPTSPTK